VPAIIENEIPVNTTHILLSLRFLCRPTTLYIIARAVEHQSAIYTENSGFASPTLGQHISTFRGYQIEKKPVIFSYAMVNLGILKITFNCFLTYKAIQTRSPVLLVDSSYKSCIAMDLSTV
jgi:hypothetical protein